MARGSVDSFILQNQSLDVDSIPFRSPDKIGEMGTFTGKEKRFYLFPGSSVQTYGIRLTFRFLEKNQGPDNVVAVDPPISVFLEKHAP